MKILIAFVGLWFCFSAYPNQSSSESNWKFKLREFITSVVGIDLTNKFFGEEPPKNSPDEMTLPIIPKIVKKGTDLSGYSKKEKGPTDFDKLPEDRRRSFDFKFLKELFLVTRKLPAKDEDLANWMNALEQAGTREGIYQSLVLDEVYNGLENMEDKSSQSLLDFCLQFSEKYLNQTFKQDSISDLNLFSLKRIFTEKGLDILEHFESNDLDSLYRWYAVFSSEMALKHSDFIKSKVRQNPSSKSHYEWAKKMPIQHIKSEFIIKMHIIMNGLQEIDQK